MMYGYDPIEDTLKVNSVQKKWRDTFNSPALETSRWDLAQSGLGMAYSEGNGTFTVTTGTTLDDALVLTSRETFSVPFRAMVGLNLSQRITGQSIYIEMVSVDRETLQPDEQHVAAWRLDGTSATAGIYEVATKGSPRLMSAASTITSTAKGTSEMTGTALEIELFADEAWFHSRALDSANTRTASYCRTTQVPDPNRLYKLRLRVVNRQMLDSVTAIAAHTDTSIKITRASHGLTTGDTVTVTNVAGLSGVSFPWTGTVTVLDTSSFTLNGTAAFTGTWINTGWTQVSKNAGPASSTTLNLIFASMLDYAELTAEITAGRGQNVAAQALAVQITGGSVTSGNGSNSTGSTFAVAKGVSSNPTVVTTGRTVDLLATLIGALVTKPYSIPEADWQFASALTGIATGADTTLRAAVASNRQYLTALQLQNLGSVATEFQVKDGATVIWRASLPAAMASPVAYDFPTPLRATTNTALNCQAVTASSAVVVNAQGYQAP